MNTLTVTDDYRSLFIGDRPLLDVRAPVEFSQGAFPGAHNLPLLDDREREQIGICYKQHGQDAAIALGHQLVGGDLRAQRTQAWCDFARQHPDAVLYCFRGGLRSRTVQQWMHEAGVDIPLVSGGYKALRRFLIDTLDTISHTQRFIIIGGPTGSGKTVVVQALAQAVDLEAAANHKGSSFGRPIGEQPTQIDFENRVGIALLKKESHTLPVFLEDESLLIGRCSLPKTLRDAMQAAPRVLVEESLSSRAQQILHEYVIEQRAGFRSAYGEAEGDARYQQALLDSLHRIRRRLGGVRYQQLRQQMESALHEQLLHDRPEAHMDWITGLLEDYYDPMYTYQLSQHDSPILFKGSRADVIHWCQQQESPS
ncbi:MAG: tRNA 2-selenouridine(34) synthase MnmH [Gammaproteobacteria bacterium]|nr:MAG: tRNA 2-selenouridine(34) synthase MnmH [Gammaproteobacteria bacterium]